MSRILQLALVVLAGCVLVAGGFGVKSYYQHRKSLSSQGVVASDEYDPRVSKPDKTFKITVDDGTLVSGPAAIAVAKGDSVTVAIAALGAEARLKLAGYDVITEASPGAPGGFKFIADKTGSFDFYVLPENDDEQAVAAPVKLGAITVR